MKQQQFKMPKRIELGLMALSVGAGGMGYAIGVGAKLSVILMMIFLVGFVGGILLILNSQKEVEK